MVVPKNVVQDLSAESVDWNPEVGKLVLAYENLRDDESHRQKGHEKDVEIRRIKEVEAARCAKTKLISESDQTRLDQDFLDKYVGETAGKDFNSPGLAFLSRVRKQKEEGMLNLVAWEPYSTLRCGRFLEQV